MHPQLSGRPSRVLMLKELMDYVTGFEGVWLPRPIDVVDYLALGELAVRDTQAGVPRARAGTARGRFAAAV